MQSAECTLCLALHRLRVEEVVQLGLLNSGEGDPLGPVQLARLELWWLDTLSLDGLLLLGEVPSDEPLDLLHRHLEELSYDTGSNDGPRRGLGHLGPVAQEEGFPRQVVPLGWCLSHGPRAAVSC